MLTRNETIDFTGNMSDMNALFICAVRYSLGRSTYMPTWIMEIVRKNEDLLQDNTISVLIRDIAEQGIWEDEYNQNAYGMDCDYKAWMSFLDWLKEIATKKNIALLD